MTCFQALRMVTTMAVANITRMVSVIFLGGMITHHLRDMLLLLMACWKELKGTMKRLWDIMKR